MSLTFDDGRASQEVARGILADHGLAATFYVNSGLVGGPGYLSWEQVDALASAGHEIGGHTVSHPHLAEVPADKARREIGADREALLGRGYAVTTFAYPYGEGHAEPAVRAAVQDSGYSIARRAWGLLARGRPPAETIPPGDRWAVKTPDGVRADTALSAIQEMIETADREGGGWVPLVFHDVGEGWGDEWTTPSETFDALLGWLVERGTAVRTVAQVAG